MYNGEKNNIMTFFKRRPLVKILVCYHKKDELFKNDILVPIHCGRKIAFENSKDGKITKEEYNWLLKNTIGDDTGENISELNREVNEWSAIYWAWKNYDKLQNPEYIGLCHYRRLLDFSKISGINFKKDAGYNVESLRKILSKHEFIYRNGIKITDKTVHGFELYQSIVKLSENYHKNLYEQYLNFNEE